MGKRGWIAVGVAAATIALNAALAGPSIAERIMHPRDVDTFLAYVNKYADGWAASDDPNGPAQGKAWVKAHPAEVLAEGDRSCAWLADQPKAPEVDPTGAFAFGTVFGNYLHQEQSFANQELSSYARGSVVAGAWAYLCHGARESATTQEAVDD